jgi:hypothetical protein
MQAKQKPLAVSTKTLLVDSCSLSAAELAESVVQRHEREFPAMPVGWTHLTHRARCVLLCIRGWTWLMLPELMSL